MQPMITIMHHGNMYTLHLATAHMITLHTQCHSHATIPPHVKIRGAHEKSYFTGLQCQSPSSW